MAVTKKGLEEGSKVLGNWLFGAKLANGKSHGYDANSVEKNSVASLAKIWVDLRFESKRYRGKSKLIKQKSYMIFQTLIATTLPLTPRTIL